MKAWGPFRWWSQNLADERARERIDDEISDALVALAGSPERWREISEARETIRRLLKGKLGSLWREGRAWLYVYRSTAARTDGREESLGTIGLEWHLLKRQHSLGFSLDVDPGEGEATISLRIPRNGVYLTVPLPRAWLKRLDYHGRELGVNFHNGALWFKLWNDPHECNYQAPFRDPQSRKRQPVLHLDNLIFGKSKHRSEDLETFAGTLNLDGGYEITARRFVSEWRRPRWPIPRRVMRVEIEIPGGIPIPGKGENGWDCEDDAIFGRTAPAKTIEEAARQLIVDVEQTRRKRGGRDWKPRVAV